MDNNYYFTKLIEEINDVKKGINLLQEIEQSSEWAMESLQRKRQELDRLNRILITYCAFQIQGLSAFIKNILESIEGCQYEIVSDKEKIVIKAADNEEKTPIVFPQVYEAYEENGNLVINPIKDEPLSSIDPLHFTFLNCFDLDFLNEENDIIKAYPYLKDILTDLIGYHSRVLEYKSADLDEKEVFDYMKELISIKYPHLGKKGYALPEALKSVADHVIKGIIENDIDYIHGTTIEERKDFYTSLIKGDYNEVAKREYWFFYRALGGELLSKWHALRKKMESAKKGCASITPENYIVFAALIDIWDHMKHIEERGQYYISINGHIQTPATLEEKKQFEKLVEEVLSRDYNWREAREVVRNVSRLNVMTDYKFPHNMDPVVSAFDPKVVTFYEKYGDISLNSDLTAIQNRALAWTQLLSADSLSELFQTPNRDGIDEYLKRMILSQFDIPKVVRNSYGGNFKEKLEYIKEELEVSATLSPETCEILFGDVKNNKELYSLAFGVLASLSRKIKINDILELCKENQKYLNCRNGIVGTTDMNTLRLPNGQVISSLYYGDIRPWYNRIQQCYEFYYNCPNDLEFVEGCVEIFGDVLMTQIFRLGNKRTAKCLFNELLMSRGIIPPIMDLNENEKELWDALAAGRFDRYPAVKARILQDTIEIKSKVQDPNLQLATSVSLDALNRAEFKPKRYY